jgi:hypothetical protein
MSDLNNIVQVTITRETQAVARSSFGTPGIISEFATDKTTATFDRYREYASLTEMSDDGWSGSDPEYDAATLFFSQNPKVTKVMIGRRDAGDADWDEALNAIQSATQDWYTMMLIASEAATVVFDIDFVTGNLIDFTINGTAVTQVPFTTDQATTMAALVTQIETDIADSSVTISDTKTLIIEVFGGVATASVIVTAGATQPVGTVTYVNEDDYKAAAAWAETQKKIFFYCSSSAAIKDPVSTTDIAYFMKNLAYDRTVSLYHDAAQGDATPSWFEAGAPGEALPFDPGSQTWMFKTISGLAAYPLTSSERTAILGKNCGIYTTTAGVNITEEGKVASGEYIDIIRGLDWVEARLQENVFANLVNKRKVPFTDEGITLIAGTVEGTLQEAAAAGLLVSASIVVNAPLAADVPSADKIARNLPDITFTATLQGAIHNVEIEGVVTV